MKILILFFYFLHQLTHANSILNYGIVTPDDLEVDRWRGSAYVWKCFSVKNAKLVYRTWRDDEKKWRRNPQGEMCDIFITAQDREQKYEYCARRAHEIEYCREMERKWKKLTKGEAAVCLNGDGPNDNSPARENPRLYTFDKFKTKKGCYSNFKGYCDISYWKTQGFPNGRVK